VPQVGGMDRYRTKISCGTKNIHHSWSSKSEVVDEVLVIGHDEKVDMIIVTFARSSDSTRRTALKQDAFVGTSCEMLV